MALGSEHMRAVVAKTRVPPEQMSGRARRYLAVCAARHLLVAWTTWWCADRYPSPLFTQIKGVLPLWCWGIVFAGAGLACGVAAVLGREHLARVGLILSAASTALWAGGFTATWILGQVTLLLIVSLIIFWAVTFKDLIVCEQPLRSPFETLSKQRAGRSPDPQKG